MNDVRFLEPNWDARPTPGARRKVRILAVLALPLVALYFLWLLQPERIGHPVLYGILIAAEIFNVVQAMGFWWTCSRMRARPQADATAAHEPVDVFIPTYDEPVEVVEPTVIAAMRLRGVKTVHVLDDGGRAEFRAMAERHGARHVTRAEHVGAKAGNVNHALGVTDAPFVAILDCDHVPDERFLEATLGHMADARVAMVQTPQYYANNRDGRIASASWAQQALFFGPIACGKDGHGAMFCCGTNVLFRRAALESVGGFPTHSVTEDFELSLHLHEHGWKTTYVPDVLTRGLGPEDMASYVSQQQRWARGCLSGIKTALRAELPWRMRVQYLLSSMFFLSGWTVLVYMAMPVIRIFSGEQPLATAGADQFLAVFAPYFGWSLLIVAMVGGGSYTFSAFALQTASFWIHVQATVLTLFGRRGKFVVTPKQGTRERQLKPVLPALALLLLLVSAALYGMTSGLDPAMLNNVAFALVHICVLTAGVWGALAPSAAAPERAAAGREPEAVAEGALRRLAA
jgi:cellulose synthase (UDP-forming)